MLRTKFLKVKKAGQRYFPQPSEVDVKRLYVSVDFGDAACFVVDKILVVPLSYVNAKGRSGFQYEYGEKNAWNTRWVFSIR